MTITQQADGDLHIHHTDDDGDTFSLVVDVDGDGDEADAADDEEAAAEDGEQDVEEEGPHDESREAIKLILQEEDETKIAMDEAKSPIQTYVLGQVALPGFFLLDCNKLFSPDVSR